jgi:hypothetical protein
MISNNLDGKAMRRMLARARHCYIILTIAAGVGVFV